MVSNILIIAINHGDWVVMEALDQESATTHRGELTVLVAAAES